MRQAYLERVVGINESVADYINSKDDHLTKNAKGLLQLCIDSCSDQIALALLKDVVGDIKKVLRK